MRQANNKNEILAAIRKGKPASVPLPEVPMYPWPGNPRENFIKRLLAFDGRVIEFKSRNEAVGWLTEQLKDADASVYSKIPEIAGSMDENSLTPLAKAANIRICVAEGELGVGEMGAIWVTDKCLGHAACALLARRLFILLDAQKIRGGLHEAYAAIKLAENQYGAFYSGPSATADIEAVHITGAQGPLELTAVLYNCADAPDQPQLQVNPNADTSIWAKELEVEE